MPDIKITVAFISGFFALVGGFVGAWLTRKTEYQKWLRQQRSAEFAEFIRQFEALRLKASDIIYDSQLGEREKDMRLTELFVKLTPQENIVRLYLDKTDRKNFSGLIHDLWSFYSPTVEQAVRMKKHKELIEGIQSMFENTIKG
jgi:hypothetical protein